MPISPSPKLRPLRRCLVARGGRAGRRRGPERLHVRSGVRLVRLAGASAARPAATAATAATARGRRPSCRRRRRCTGASAAGAGGPECATLAVPLNYADPGGRKITLALSMIPATAPAARQQGVLLVNPGGTGRARPLARGGGRGRAEPAGGGHLRHRRVRPARGGRFGARAELRPEFLRRGAARLHPGQRGRRAGAHRPGQGLRGRVRAAVRLAAALYDDRQHGPRHGPDPPGIRRRRRSITTGSPTAPISARSTGRCSPTGCAGWCSTPPWTRPAPGTPTTSTRTTPSRGGSTRSSPGRRSTTPPITWGRPRREVQAAYYKVRGELEKTPIAGSNGPLSARTSSTTRSSSPGT